MKENLHLISEWFIYRRVTEWKIGVMYGLDSSILGIFNNDILKWGTSAEIQKRRTDTREYLMARYVIKVKRLRGTGDV